MLGYGWVSQAPANKRLKKIVTADGNKGFIYSQCCIHTDEYQLVLTQFLMDTMIFITRTSIEYCTHFIGISLSVCVGLGQCECTIILQNLLKAFLTVIT